MKRKLRYGTLVLFITIFSIISALKINAADYKIGTKGPAGGTIVYINKSGKGGWRYMEAAPDFIKCKKGWGDKSLEVFKNVESSIEIGGGKKNTELMLKNCKQSVTAAVICKNYKLGGKTDWFLPSVKEIWAMYNAVYDTEKISIGNYQNIPDIDLWTSTETSVSTAYGLCIRTGVIEDYLKDSKILLVWPVRVF